MGKLKNAFRNILYGTILAGGLALAGCSFNKINVKEPVSVVQYQEETSSNEDNKKEERVIQEDNTKIPKVNLSLRLDPLLDEYSGASNITSANKLVMKSSDILLKKINFDNILGRSLKVLALDIPLTSFFIAYQHEQFGHVYRAREQGVRAVAHNFLFYPLVTKRRPYATTEKLFWDLDPDNHVKEVLFDIGGLESEIVMSNKVVEDILKKDKHSFYDAFMYLAEKNRRVEVFGKSRPKVSEVSELERLEYASDDIFSYMDTMKEKFGVNVSANNIFNGCLWEMADSVYFLSFIHSLEHIFEGIRQIKNPKFMFTTNYNLTPFGSEFYLNLYNKDDKGLLTKVYGRVGIKNNCGVGFKIMNIPLETKVSDNLNVGVDLWNQHFPERLRKYSGFGLGINLEVEKDIGKGINLNLGVRAKTKGYNLGDSLETSVNGYIGLSGEF